MNKKNIQYNISLDQSTISLIDDLRASEYSNELSTTQVIKIILKNSLKLEKSKLLNLLGRPAV